MGMTEEQYELLLEAKLAEERKFYEERIERMRMSLLDEFAMAALANAEYVMNDAEDTKDLVKACYAVADEMMRVKAARAKSDA